MKLRFVPLALWLPVLPRIAIASLLALSGGYACSQTAGNPRPMEPSEPHEALAFFEGTWSVPGKSNWRESCAWLAEGRRHMVCKPRWENPTENREGLSIFSYDETERVYLSHGFKPSGLVTADKGQRIAQGFRFMSDTGAGAERVQDRLTLEEGAGGMITVTSETAKGDGPWVVQNKTQYQRTKP